MTTKNHCSSGAHTYVLRSFPSLSLNAGKMLFSALLMAIFAFFMFPAAASLVKADSSNFCTTTRLFTCFDGGRKSDSRTLTLWQMGAVFQLSLVYSRGKWKAHTHSNRTDTLTPESVSMLFCVVVVLQCTLVEGEKVDIWLSLINVQREQLWQCKQRFFQRQ